MVGGDKQPRLRTRGTAHDEAEDQQSKARVTCGKTRKRPLQGHGVSPRVSTERSRRKYHERPAKQVLRTTSIELRPRLEGDDAATNPDRNGLGPILGAKFVHNAFDVNLDGA